MNYVIDNTGEYIVWLVSDFANRFGLTNVQAYDYLARFKAVEFIESFYDVLHTFSLDDAVDDVVKFCRRMGGTL